MNASKTVSGGLLAIFEGIDGVGKTTQLQMAATALRDEGWLVYVTRNLGGTPIGEALREVMLSPTERPAETELYISVAIQAALREAIAAERQKGSIILMDRGPLSMAMYHIYGSGVDETLGWQHARQGLNDLKPELIMLYDADVKTAVERARKHSAKADYFESKPLSFFERIAAGYIDASTEYGASVIDANQSIDDVHVVTMKLLHRALKTTS